MEKEYYVYAHYVVGHSSPIYIGKGKGPRAWSFSGRTKRWNGVTNGHPDEVRIVQSEMSEVCALTLEKIIISFWGTDWLTNIAREGISQKGVAQTPEANEKRRIALLGPKNHNYGAPLPRHVQEAARLVNTGRKQSIEERKKKSSAVSGLKHPQLDKSVRKFIHKSGLEFVGLRYEFIKRFNLSPPKVCCLINGSRNVHKGWRYVK